MKKTILLCLAVGCGPASMPMPDDAGAQDSGVQPFIDSGAPGSDAGQSLQSFCNYDGGWNLPDGGFPGGSGCMYWGCWWTTVGDWPTSAGFLWPSQCGTCNRSQASCLSTCETALSTCCAQHLAQNPSDTCYTGF